jgi:vitamin B12 transporter
MHGVAMKRGRERNVLNAVNGVFVILALFMMLPAFALAEQSEEEKNFLLMYFKEEELQVVSSTRSIKSISKVAENLTVVTAADIERMNAHTLADVLNTVNGVQVWFSPTSPGNLAQAMIEGSSLGHVTVLIDGVPQQNLGSNFTDLGIIPVQNIERVEIIKGPASSTWGSSLGGVINVITKNPFENGLHGNTSISYGTRNTEDYRAEIGGRLGDVGLFFSAGGIHSDGLRFGSEVRNNNLYSKLTYALLPSTDITATGMYLKSGRGRGDFREAFSGDIETDRTEQYFGTVAVNSKLANNIILDVSGYAQRQRVRITDDYPDFGIFSLVSDDRRYGGSAKLVLKLENNTVVLGSDYDRGTEKNDSLIDGRQTLTKWAVFANDTVTLGSFAITPGIRYEATNHDGDFISPSIGATYELTKKTILRAAIARGFNIPALGDNFGPNANPELKVEKVMSYQVGAESGELKYVWLKGSLFRHDLNDVLILIDTDGDGLGDKTVNGGKERRQGFEVEMKTIPAYNTTFSAGTTYIFAKDLQTNQIITMVPKYTYDMAVTYDDNKSLKAQLKGRYIWWNAGANINGYPMSESKYSNFLVDLSVAKTIYKYKDQRLEAFVVGHNLLNANQYMIGWYRNASRWGEIGFRYKF